MTSRYVTVTVGLHPVLVLDVFEHAWMVDYGAGEKGKYVEAFLENVSREVVERRFKDRADAPAVLVREAR